ncbi:MAG: bacteriophage Gp15 family protein [Eubacterium sp.]
MIFSGSLPKTLTIDAMTYPINGDFRVMASFEIGMQQNPGNEKAVILDALCQFYPDGVPVNVEASVEKMLWFYRCGKEEDKETQGSPRKAKQVYSFEEDEGYIFSAFLDQYGINLINVEFLHWWVFRKLFNGLKEDNEFVKIMGYRAVKIDRKMAPDQRKFYRKMQEQYKLKDYRTEEQREQAMIDAFASLF